MVFSSITFLLYFLPPFLVVYRLGGAKLSNLTLLLASIVFYAWGAFSFLPILLGSCVVNYYLVEALSKMEGLKRKQALVASIILNVSILVYFKYANFIVESFHLKERVKAIRFNTELKMLEVEEFNYLFLNNARPFLKKIKHFLKKKS